MDKEVDAAATIAALGQARRGVVVAPAGHGKTEAICGAIARSDPGKALVLTHTNAGVAALRARLEKLCVPAARAEVTTLHKWAYRLCRAYPRTASWSEASEFDECMTGAATVVATEFFGRVLRATFGAVYVDEYQDCGQSQHALVCAVAEQVPCRVLGDPLQAIYRFGSGCIEWDSVLATFDLVGELPIPWRWKHLPELGVWLLAARDDLLTGRPVRLDGPIRRVESSDRTAIWKCCDRGGTSLILGNPQGRRYISLGKQFAWLGYRVVEANDRPDLRRAANDLDEATGQKLALCILGLAAKWMNGVSKSTLKPLYTYFEKGASRSKKFPELRARLDKVAADGSARSISSAFKELAQLGGVYRSQTFWPLMRALKRMRTGAVQTVTEAVQVELADLRFRQTRLPRRAIASTLLAKGLQADNVIIFDPDKLDARNLYVALTRATTTITVVTSRDELDAPL